MAQNPRKLRAGQRTRPERDPVPGRALVNLVRSKNTIVCIRVDPKRHNRFVFDVRFQFHPPKGIRAVTIVPPFICDEISRPP
jgi:hypothetical protein